MPSTHVGKKYTVEKIDDGKYIDSGLRVGNGIMAGQRWRKSSCRWFERKIGKRDWDWNNIDVVKLRGKDERMSVSRALDGERDKRLKINDAESSQSTTRSTRSLGHCQCVEQ